MKKLLIVFILVGLIGLLTGCGKSDLEKRLEAMDFTVSEKSREAINRGIEEGRDLAQQSFGSQKDD